MILFVDMPVGISSGLPGSPAAGLSATVSVPLPINFSAETGKVKVEARKNRMVVFNFLSKFKITSFPHITQF